MKINLKADKDLKSNMDRFIVIYKGIILLFVGYLKSNMDRFIERYWNK